MRRLDVWIVELPDAIQIFDTEQQAQNWLGNFSKNIQREAAVWNMMDGRPTGKP